MSTKKERRKLLFGKGLLAPVLSGQKQCTIRKFRVEAHNLKAGEEFVGEFADGRSLDLVCTHDTICIEAGRLSDHQARADGFASAEDCLDGLSEYYPDLNDESILAYIRFSIAPAKKK